MSPTIELVYHSFLDGLVPKLWGDNSYLSLKPLASWINDLILRVKFMTEWLYDGTAWREVGTENAYVYIPMLYAERALSPFFPHPVIIVNTIKNDMPKTTLTILNFLFFSKTISISINIF